MSKKADPPKSTKQATSKTPAEKKKPKEAEDWIAEIIPKKKKPSVQKLNDDDLSDVIVNKIPGIGPAVSEKLMSAGS